MSAPRSDPQPGAAREEGGWRRWLDPTGVRAAVLLALVFAAANAIWVFLDSSTPSWDQAHYLDVTWQYHRALEVHGPISFLQTVHNADPGHGPLFTLAMTPFLMAFGDSARSGLLLGVLISPLLYLATGQIAKIVFGSWRARLLAIPIVAMTPLLVGLGHNVLQDFLLATLAALSMLALLKTDLFRNRRASVLLGVAMGLGALTKVTFPAFAVGPVAVILVRTAIDLRDQRGSGAEDGLVARRLANMALALGVFLVISLAWYIPNFEATREYVRSTTSGPLAEGAGAADPYSLRSFYAFTTVFLNLNLSWVLVLAGLASLALNLRTIGAWLRRPRNTAALGMAAFLVSWIVIPYLSVALSHNQGVRLMAAAFPGLAVLIAGGLAAIPWPRLRVALVGVTLLALAFQTANRVVRLEPDFLPAQASVSVAGETLATPISSSYALGDERLPEDDLASPVLRYIESKAPRDENGQPLPQTLCMLVSNPVINTNTFTFLVNAHEDPYTVVDVVVGPEGMKGLEASLEACDFALYVKPEPVTDETAGTRLVLVNEDFAAGYMTPKLFGLFPGPSRMFRIAATAPEPSDAGPLTAASAGDYVRVLTDPR